MRHTSRGRKRPHSVYLAGAEHQCTGMIQQPFLEVLFVNLWLRHKLSNLGNLGWILTGLSTFWQKT
jgi:hypothetical protein